MTVDSNSIKAYYEDMDRIESIREKIFYVIGVATHPSSSDIARLTNIQRTSVTGRLRELEEEGRI